MLYQLSYSRSMSLRKHRTLAARRVPPHNRLAPSHQLEPYHWPSVEHRSSDQNGTYCITPDGGDMVNVAKILIQRRFLKHGTLPIPWAAPG